MCLEIYDLDPAKSFLVPRLAQQTALRNTKVELDVLTEFDMLLIAEKHITGEICHSVYRFAKSNNKYMKNYDKNKESSCLHYWDVNNLYGWAM